jgi:hypothetical protein
MEFIETKVPTTGEALNAAQLVGTFATNLREQSAQGIVGISPTESEDLIKTVYSSLVGLHQIQNEIHRSQQREVNPLMQIVNEGNKIIIEPISPDLVID